MRLLKLGIMAARISPNTRAVPNPKLASVRGREDVTKKVIDG